MSIEAWIWTAAFFCMNLVCWSLRLRRRLKPAICMCAHGNHLHDSKGVCHVAFGVSEKFPNGSTCACYQFIAKPAEKVVKDPQVAELERMFKK